MRRLSPLVLVLAWAAMAVAPASADPGGTALQRWRFNGDRLATAARLGRTVYVAGDFNAVAPAANDLGSVGIFGTGATPVRATPLAGEGTAIAEDGAGGFFVGRTVATNVLSMMLSHVLADGSIATNFQPSFDGPVTALTRVGTVLYAGGAFTTVNGQARGRGAAFDTATGALLPWNPQAGNGSIDAIAAAGPGRVYIGGTFVTVAGASAIGLVRLSATSGAIDAFVNVSLPGGSVVTALLTAGNVMYVAGTFGSIQGLPRQRLAAIDLTTSMVTPFDASFAGPGVRLMSLAVSGPHLYVGGAFSVVSGQLRDGIAQLDAVTGAVTPWRVRTDRVESILAVGSTLYLAGGFTHVDGEARVEVAALDVTGGAATLLPWNPGLLGRSLHLAASTTGAIAVTGTPLTYGAQARGGIAAVDLVSGDLLPFAPVVDTAYVQAIDVTASAVYLGGPFTAVNGAPRNGLAAVDAQGRLLPWNPSDTLIDVETIRADGATVFVGGSFVRLGGQLRGNLAAVDNVSGAARPWRADANGPVTVLQVAGATLYAGGVFTTIGGQARSGVAALDTGTAALRPFTANVSGGDVHDLHVSNGLLYLAGAFTAVNGQARRYVAAVDGTSGAPTSFAPAVDGDVDRVAARDGAVYLAGRFTLVNSAPRNGLAAVGAGSGLVTQPFTPAFARVKAWVGLVPGADLLVAVSVEPANGPHLFADTAMAGVSGPPSAPRAVVRGATLAIDWQPALVGGPPASYVLEASVTPGGAPFASIPVGSAAFTVGGVPPGTYYLGVRALNAAGSSVASPRVGVTVGVPGCGEPPAPPLLSTVPVAGVASLRWTPSTGQTTSYTMVVGRSAGASDIGVVPLGATSAFTSPAPPGVYFARLVGSGACGISAPSPDVPIVVDVAPLPASPLVDAQVSGRTVSIAWSAVPGALGYRFEAGSGPLLRNLASATTASTTLVAGGVPPGTYYVRVVALGATGESLRPDEVVVIVR